MLKLTLTLQISGPELTICRLPPTIPFPDWIGDKDFVAVTRTPDEFSIVCYEVRVPGEIKADRFDRALEILELSCLIEN